MLQKRLSEQVNATVLLLPVGAGHRTKTEKKQARAQQEQRRREREDTYGTTCLHREGYEVKSFQDGVEALHWCGAPEARIPALVLVDVGLPKLDGYDVIRHLKARPALAQTVFVIISRRDGVLDRLKGRLAGAHAYLTKPFKTDEVVAMVQAHLGSLAAEKPAGWK